MLPGQHIAGFSYLVQMEEFPILVRLVQRRSHPEEIAFPGEQTYLQEQTAQADFDLTSY